MKKISTAAIAGVLLLAGTVTVSADTFREATRPPYVQPPRKSINGRTIVEMRDQVSEVWDTFDLDSKDYVATIVTDKGDIVVEFYEDVAPNTVRSFLGLSKVGFYDDLIFHRCIPNFVIQGGCPKGDGTGGPGYCLKPEFNAKPHDPGVLSMARAQPLDSAGSQFFICHGKAAFLDNKYTAFGKVVSGMKVVDQIATAPTGPGDRPRTPVKIQGVTISTK